MRIAVVGPIYPYRGGIAHYTALLAAQFARTYSVRVYSFQRQYPNWLFPGRSQYDHDSPPLAQVETFQWLTPWWPSTWLRVKRDWDEWRPDVIVLQWWVPIMAAMTAYLGRLNPNTVVVCHNAEPHEHAPWDRLLIRWALRRAKGMVVHSQRERLKLHRLLPTAAIRVTPHPTYAAFDSTTWTRAAARTALKYDGKMLLFFGLVRPYKGLLDLIEALALVDASVHLWVVGEIWGSARVYLERLKALGLEQRVHFVDQYVSNDEAAMYFAATDVAVLPYRDATGSGVLQMAFGLGVPVIATKTGGMDEAVEDGVTGFLVAPRSASELGQAIQRFFGEDRSATFRAAIRQRQGRFVWENMTDTILHLAGRANAFA